MMKLENGLGKTESSKTEYNQGFGKDSAGNKANGRSTMDLAQNEVTN